MHKLPFRLMFITDRNRCHGRDLLSVVRLAMKGGLRAIQFRDKDLPAFERYHLAAEIARACQSADCLLFINDRVDIALAVNAAGVHLPENGMPIPVARRLIRPKMWVGRSVHDVNTARAAEKDGADYIIFGPIYPTPGKSPRGLPALKAVVQAVRTPVIAVGGIHVDNAAAVLEAGASAIAVIGAIGTAPDVTEAVRQLKRVVNEP